MTPTAKEWIARGKCTEVPPAISVRFDEYLRSLPWQTYSLDWRHMPAHTTIDVSVTSATDFGSWIRGAAIGAHNQVAVWYSVTEGGIIVPASVVTLDTLDELYWEAPGVRFSFGIDVGDDGLLHPAYQDLLEYGEGDILTAISR